MFENGVPIGQVHILLCLKLILKVLLLANIGLPVVVAGVTSGIAVVSLIVSFSHQPSAKVTLACVLLFQNNILRKRFFLLNTIIT